MPINRLRAVALGTSSILSIQLGPVVARATTASGIFSANEMPSPLSARVQELHDPPQRDWTSSSVPRRLAVAGVGLVSSPVGLGRHGFGIETARDKEFLCCADEVALTEEVRGGLSYGVQVAQHLEHLCLMQPVEGGRRRASRRRTRFCAMTCHEEGGSRSVSRERFEQSEGGWHRGVVDDEEMGRRR